MGRIFIIRILIEILSVFYLIFCSSCASPPELKQYPERQIGRPYTLPRRLNTWQLLTTGYFTSTLTQNTNGIGGIFPLNWEQGLTDSLTLIWSPLPFQFKYQFYHQPQSDYLGIYFNFLGPLYMRDGFDFNWSPLLQLTYRRLFLSQWAVDFTFLIEAEIKKSTPFNTGIVGFEFTLWNQISDPFAIGIRQGFLEEIGFPHTRYLGPLLPDRADSSRLLFPFHVILQDMVAEQWQIDLDYQFLSIPSSDHYISHQLLCILNYFW